MYPPPSSAGVVANNSNSNNSNSNNSNSKSSSKSPRFEVGGSGIGGDGAATSTVRSPLLNSNHLHAEDEQLPSGSGGSGSGADGAGAEMSVDSPLHRPHAGGILAASESLGRAGHKYTGIPTHRTRSAPAISDDAEPDGRYIDYDTIHIAQLPSIESMADAAASSVDDMDDSHHSALMSHVTHSTSHASHTPHTSHSVSAGDAVEEGDDYDGDVETVRRTRMARQRTITFRGLGAALGAKLNDLGESITQTAARIRRSSGNLRSLLHLPGTSQHQHQHQQARVRRRRLVQSVFVPLPQGPLAIRLAAAMGIDNISNARDAIQLRRRLGVQTDAYTSHQPFGLQQTQDLDWLASISETALSSRFHTHDHQPPLSIYSFLDIVDGVQRAIEGRRSKSNPNQWKREPQLPTRISAGSSGSYFCRNSNGKILAVFKPKNEEPYGQFNPKLLKWIHRNLFPCFFGRSCLIPNTGYVSEAAASHLDKRLGFDMVPRTEVVALSASSFNYPARMRRLVQTGRRLALPEKPGSFQRFLHGFVDANVFLAANPWPDTDDRLDDEHSEHGNPQQFKWTKTLRSQFIELVQRMVCLDFLMRNTDRSLNNWMVRYCPGPCSLESPATDTTTSSTGSEVGSDDDDDDSNDEYGDHDAVDISSFGHSVDPRRMSTAALLHDNNANPISARLNGNSNNNNRNINTASISEHYDDSNDPVLAKPHLHLCCIDNGLAFPYKHPDSFRSYPYGWLSLPPSLIRQPFTKAIRAHVLPLLTSTAWWAALEHDLRDVFNVDKDFNDGMFEKQMSVIKGQGWNLMQSLMGGYRRHRYQHQEQAHISIDIEHLEEAGEGPVELCERPPVLVNEVEVPRVSLGGMSSTASLGQLLDPRPTRRQSALFGDDQADTHEPYHPHTGKRRLSIVDRMRSGSMSAYDQTTFTPGYAEQTDTGDDILLAEHLVEAESSPYFSCW